MKNNVYTHAYMYHRQRQHRGCDDESIDRSIDQSSQSSLRTSKGEVKERKGTTGGGGGTSTEMPIWLRGVRGESVSWSWRRSWGGGLRPATEGVAVVEVDSRCLVVRGRSGGSLGGVDIANEVWVSSFIIGLGLRGRE